MKKVLKKRLKKDELVSTMTKLIELAKKWSRQLMIGIAAVTVIILAFLISSVIKTQAVKKESRVLTDILEISTQLNDNPEKVAELEALAGNGKFSRIAYLKLAAWAIEKGDSANAKAYLEQMKDDRKDITYYQAQDMLAQVYIRDKEFDKAIAIYKAIEEEDQKDYPPDVVLFHLAEAHEGKGERDVALEIYKRIQEEYSQSYYGFDASKKVSELEGKK
jgi:predicted negative regulator of RcsB-dependent stress response